MNSGAAPCGAAALFVSISDSAESHLQICLFESSNLVQTDFCSKSVRVSCVRIGRIVDWNGQNVSVTLDESFVAVECSQIALFQFFNCRIYRVAACACIVECPLRHAVNCIQEFLFNLICRLVRMILNQVFPDGLRNINFLLQVFSSLDPVFECLFVSLALNTDQFTEFNISLECLRILVLRECSHVIRMFLSVESADIREEQCVCSSVWNVEPSADLMRQ